MERIENIPALAFMGSEIAVAHDGDVRRLDARAAASYLTGAAPIMLCHHLGVAEKITAPVYDVMTLWAFIHPARQCVPSVSGLAKFLDLPPPATIEAAALLVCQAARILLAHVAQMREESAVPIAQMMRAGGWRWAELVLAQLKPPPSDRESLFSRIVKDLPQWVVPKTSMATATEEAPPEITSTQMLRDTLGESAESRAGQLAYMKEVEALFTDSRRKKIFSPEIMLAQADTGIGKTMGYLVPAFLMARAIKQPIWIATYTRALQNQIKRETARLPKCKIAIRKGRENYLCLLNFEESLRGVPYDPILAGLIARWLGASRDGDIRSGDFPSWLVSGWQRSSWVSSLTDHRQTCIHSACPHYQRCFVERQRVAALDADIIIANHALVLSQSLFVNKDAPPAYYIFDEGHHIFSAADNAFSFYLTARTMSDLRHWLMGSGTRTRWSDQGLAARMPDVLARNDHIRTLLDEVCAAAEFLPQSGWQERLSTQHPLTLAEVFLDGVARAVLAAQDEQKNDNGYTLESVPQKLSDMPDIKAALTDLQKVLAALAAALAELEESMLVSILRVLRRWTEHELPVWIAMSDRACGKGALVQWVDRFVIEREEGRLLDIGMVRHALDPGHAFAQHVLSRARATLITSASLSYDSENETEDRNNQQTASGQTAGGQTADGQSAITGWQTAEWQTGARHLSTAPKHFYAGSPFDYAKAAKVFVVSDVGRDVAALAHAMAALFCASSGGALGLWTAIRRLRSAHPMIARHLHQAGLLLLAQHVDNMALPALMDIFREEKSSCLLGTDALRDGMDVPGEALRLIVFDRVPWPRPDILHRARRRLFPPRFYDDMVAGLRLQQAFGRLIRRQSDRGIFVLLDRGFPSRLKKVFPKEVGIERLPLDETLKQVQAFYS